MGGGPKGSQTKSFHLFLCLSINGYPLSSGADPRIVNEEGEMAVDIAREGGHSKCVEVLEVSTEERKEKDERGKAFAYLVLFLSLSSILTLPLPHVYIGCYDRRSTCCMVTQSSISE